ncbi:MAG: hypothetical protein WCR79_01740 [Fusobacterium sp.]
MKTNWKYEKYNKSDIVDSLEQHRVARFYIGDKEYSLYRNNAVSYDLVQDNLEVTNKLKKFKSLEEVFNKFEKCNQE